MDAGNLLKPMLARGELHCIGATTLDEYRQYIEKDRGSGAPVPAGAWWTSPRWRTPSAILRGLKERYEVFHGVKITDRRHHRRRHPLQPLYHRPLPAGQGHRPGGRGLRHDPHRDRLHAHGAGRHLTGRSCSCEIEEAALKKEDDDALSQGAAGGTCKRSWRSCARQFNAMKAKWENEKKAIGQACRSCARRSSRPTPRLKRRERELRPGTGGRAAVRHAARAAKASWQRRSRSREEGKERDSLLRDKVTEEEIARDRRAAGRAFPCRKLMEGEREKLLHLEDILHQRVIGQDEAVAKVSEAILRSRAGIAGPQPAHRLLPVPGPHRRRQDRAGQGAGAGAV